MWQEKLRQAHQEGVITAEVYEQLVAWDRSRVPQEPEKIRVISGLNDIFILMASYLVMASGAVLLGTIHPYLAVLLTLSVSWLLSVYFIEKKKIRSAGLGFLLVFALSLGALPLVLVQNVNWIPWMGICGALGALIHFAKFKTAAAIALAYVGLWVFLITGSLWLGIPLIGNFGLWVLCFAVGLGVMAHGVYWDRLDPHRRTARSDQAFWLHLVAAPLMVHSLYMVISRWISHEFALSGVFTGVYGLLIVVSLVLNRRALMISSTGYAIYAFSQAMLQGGFDSLTYVVAALVVGAVMLGLAMKWEACRGRVLGWIQMVDKLKKLYSS